MKACLTRKTNLRLTAIALIASFLFALTLSAAPQLHAWLHKDSSAPNHECAVTLIGSGRVAHSTVPVIVVAPQPVAFFTTLAVLTPTWVAAPFLGSAIFEHAPPALS